MSETDRVLQRLDALEREVAELRRLYAASTVLGPQEDALMNEVMLRVRSETLRAREREAHLHERADERAETAESMEQENEQTRRASGDADAEARSRTR
jgi:hypothetical protein